MTKETETTEVLGLALYTDGGCNPNPNGPAGWGVHGYHYAVSSQTLETQKKIDLPTTEGYRNGNGLAKGIEQVTPIKHYDYWGPLFGDTSNNIAELNAAIQGVALAKDLNASKVKMILDSEYVLKGIQQWHKKWERDNWIASTGKPVSNQGDWKKLIAAVREREAAGTVFDWEWTKGHLDNIGNVRADRNATRGVYDARRNDHHDINEVADSKDYWKPDARPSRFFGHTAWYFFTHMGDVPTSKDGRFVYHCGIHDKQSVKQGTPQTVANLRKNELWGKASGEVRYSVLFTKHQEPVLEALRVQQDLVSKNNYCNAVACDLTATFKQENYDTITRYGMNYIKTMSGTVTNDLFTLSNDMLTGEASPPRLALYAMDNVQLLERVLESCLDTTDAPYDVVVSDVTAQLYDVETKKTKTIQKIKKAIVPGLKTIKLPVQYNTTGTVKEMELSLTLGLHTPDRNTLSALADKGAKVSVVTWRESDTAFRHAFILDTEDDSSIYAAFHTNIVFLKA